MNSKKELLKKSRLYLILDKKVFVNKSSSGLVNKACPAGVDIIQLRDKESKREDILKDALFLHKLLLKRKVLFIVNDYPDIAKITDSDGVHLGQHDTSIGVARRILGKDKIIGVSCHNLKQAIQAQELGADYIGFGPLFPTPTKPEYPAIGLNPVRYLKKKIKIPVFAIGNINQDNLSAVALAGARRVAVCRAILEAENMTHAVKYFAKMLA